jgi:ribosomal protein L16/L10AE
MGCLAYNQALEAARVAMQPIMAEHNKVSAAAFA